MINPPQVLPEEPTAVTPHGGFCGGKSQQWLRYPTNPLVRICAGGVRRRTSLPRTHLPPCRPSRRRSHHHPSDPFVLRRRIGGEPTFICRLKLGVPRPIATLSRPSRRCQG